MVSTLPAEKVEEEYLVQVRPFTILMRIRWPYDHVIENSGGVHISLLVGWCVASSPGSSLLSFLAQGFYLLSAYSLQDICVIKRSLALLDADQSIFDFRQLIVYKLQV